MLTFPLTAQFTERTRDEATGKAVLRDVINATVGFEPLAVELGKPGKSLHRMLGPRGNPSTANFFAILPTLRFTRNPSVTGVR